MNRLSRRFATAPEIGPLLVLAALAEFIYVMSFLRPFSLLQYYKADRDMGAITGHSHLGYDLFIGSITLLFVLFAVSWHHLRGCQDARLLPWIFGSGAVFAVTLIFVYPMTAIDIYAYVDQSWILVHYHQNPIFAPPSAFSGDALMPLSDGWSGAGAPYGPIGLVIDAVPTLIARGNLLWNLILLKCLFSAMTLGCAYLAYRILNALEPRRAIEGALLIAWNPLVLFETSVNGHNDIVMIFFALLALLAVVEGDGILGLVLLTCACLVKFATLILLPLFLAYGISRYRSARARVRYVALACTASSLVAILAYSRFWQGIDTLSHLVSQNQRYLASFSSVVLDFWGGSVSGDTAALAGRVVFFVVYVAALAISTRSTIGLIRGCFVAMFALLAVGLTNVESWYAIWPVVLAGAMPQLAERVAVTLFAWGISLGAAFFGYEWFWLGLNSPGSFQYVNNKTYAVAFGPAILAWALLTRWPVPFNHRFRLATAWGERRSEADTDA